MQGILRLLNKGLVSNGKAKGQCPQHRKVNEHEQHRKHRISDWGIVPFERRVRHWNSDESNAWRLFRAYERNTRW